MWRDIPPTTTFSFLVLAFFIGSCSAQNESKAIRIIGNADTVTAFAPELCLDRNTYKGNFSEDYKTFYFFRKDSSKDDKYVPYTSTFENGKWSEPQLSSYYDEKHSYTYHLKVPNENRLIFISDLRTANDTSVHPNYNFWSLDLSNDNNTLPEELGPQKLIANYNSQPGIVNDGTIYFTSMTPDWQSQFCYKMEKQEGKYQEPELFESVNRWNKKEDWRVGPIAMHPDEKFLIVTIRDIPNHNFDLYISYPKQNSWTYPKKLDQGINTAQEEGFPYITSDGKYFMFTRDRSQFYIIKTKQLHE